MFTIPSAIKQAKSHLSIIIINEVTLFGYVNFFQLTQTAVSVRQLKNRYHNQISYFYQQWCERDGIWLARWRRRW